MHPHTRALVVITICRNRLDNAQMSDIEQYKSAFCVKGERINRKITTFGFYDASGSAIENTEISTTGWTTQPLPEMKETQSELQIFGPAMFGGSADKQFGFVLLNSIGRLWALDKLPPNTAIVFGSKTIKQRVIFDYVSYVLRSFGLNNSIMVVDAKTRFENLYVPREHFGEASGGRGTKIFYEWIDEKWGCKKAPKKDRKVYVTRSSLGPLAGRFTCEEHLERLLMDEGYEIYAPEQHNLTHQIETYLSADKIIFSEGSALHLFSLIRQPHQVSAVIQRRNNLPSVMASQMDDRDGLATVSINAIVSIRFDTRRGEHLSKAELDFSIIKDELVKANLILGKTWTAPTKEDLESSMRAGLAPHDYLMSYKEHRSWVKMQRKKKDHHV